MDKFLINTQTPLGANYNEKEKKVEFKLFSKNASKVFLCIFDEPTQKDPVMVLEMVKKENNIWYTSVKDYILNCKNVPVFYGFRVFGANWEYDKKFKPNSKIGFKSIFDKDNNRFNPNKLAYDPYSKELTHTPCSINPKKELFRSGGNFYLIDNAKWASKSVYKYKENIEITKVSPRPFTSEIIGEVHIKDLTQNILMPEKGTYSGAKKFAKEIKKLGITMIEFLPINEFDPKDSGTNHWGYMPLGYFSLARKYAYNKAYGNILDEFIQMVDEFHKQGIKVCLDMVYNHTGEAGLINNNPKDANLLSYALIDNSSYYKVYPDGFYRSNSGCGNDFNANNDGALDLIIDSLVYWINLGIDAFRFDLAAALLENSCNCDEIYDNINSLGAKLKEKLKEKNINVIDDFSKNDEGVVLIAEPWTCGGKQCYHLGNFPSFWAEWNDIARDTIRKITLRPKEVNPYQIKEILCGSGDIFKGKNKSINYIASHDGFSLYDLNSYTKKNPKTQGGNDFEISGDYNNDELKKERSIRKQLMILFLSYGIPMIQIGDIIMHTKEGNNNSYNKDDKTNYLDWNILENTLKERIMNFTINLINFRKQNDVFINDDFKKLTSFHYDNSKIASFDNKGYWYNPSDNFLGELIDCKKRLYIAMSKADYPFEFTLVDNKENKKWYKIMDSYETNSIKFDKKEIIEKKYTINPNSLIIFMED